MDKKTNICVCFIQNFPLDLQLEISNLQYSDILKKDKEGKLSDFFFYKYFPADERYFALKSFASQLF